MRVRFLRLHLPLAAQWVFLFFSSPAEAASYEIAVAQAGGLSGTTMLCAEQSVCSAQLPIEVDGKPEDLTIAATITPGNAYLRFKADGALVAAGGLEYVYIPLGKTGIAARTVELFSQADWSYKDSLGKRYPVWRSTFPPVMAVRISILRRD